MYSAKRLTHRTRKNTASAASLFLSMSEFLDSNYILSFILFIMYLFLEIGLHRQH